MIIGIDATNLRRGGGLTHLMELLRAVQPVAYGIDRVIVWGGQVTLNVITERPWLEKRNPRALEKGLLSRSLWQRLYLSKAARDAGCSVLFVPGGSYAGNFQPVVIMSQNLLPFETDELKRYGLSLMALKLCILRLIQASSFRKALGTIFLTSYARDAVMRVTGDLQTKTTIIPHGLSSRFKAPPKPQRDISDYKETNLYRVLYVSIIDQYKHQWSVVEAIASLRREGFPIALDLIGPAYPPALKRLKETIDCLGVDQSWVHYHGSVPFEALDRSYAVADLGLFASSCENMPNILLEMMASGLPIACSNRGPMPEMVGPGGVYFDPEVPESIASALRKLIESPKLRSEIAKISYQRAQQYSWERCADETFKFLMKVARTKGVRNV